MCLRASAKPNTEGRGRCEPSWEGLVMDCLAFDAGPSAR